ncbi:MAG: 50S ribosomal protein L15 [Chlamydiia bacterium]|nr:50S ribosomal protein L15 [Chlamydiia bacterium]
MTSLNNLKNTSRPRKAKRRVGRGIGSGLGKTCGRGEKGDGSRSGYKRRLGYEGGQMRLFMKLPRRGFSNARFRRPYDTVNLKDIERAYEDGETVSLETLIDKGFLSGPTYGVKLLGTGDLTKKVSIHLDDISESALKKIEAKGIEYSIKSLPSKA